MKKERKIINTNIRLNLMNEQDRQAWNYLRGMDRKKYKSYTKAVVLALNDYFSRQEQIVRGKVILQPHGKGFFTWYSKHLFTLHGKHFFT